MTLYQYFGTGSIYSSQVSPNIVSYNYNLNSTFDNVEDYQSIVNSSDFTDDYGEVSQSSGPTIDFYLITDIVSGSSQPFGKLTLSGSANTEWINKNFYGSAEYRVNYQYNTSGALFNIGQKVERRVFAYNESSFENTEADYGLISQVATTTDNYENITSAGAVIEYGFITETSGGIIQPFGLFNITGNSTNNSIQVFTKVGSGSLFGFNGTVESVSDSPPKNTVLFNFVGSGRESIIPATEIGSGSLFHIGQKVERRVFAYNESSFENTEADYGLIGEPALEFEDYQSINNATGTVDEFGFIIIPTGGIIQPFGKLTLSGSAITQSNYRLFFSGSSDTKVTYSPDNTSGTLFSFGEKLESVTYDYNQDSIYQNTDDYGLITSLQLAGQFDYGSITGTSGSQPDENYGLVAESIQVSTSTPFGSLYISGSALERFTADTPEDTQLFIISGSALESDSECYTSFGTRFSIPCGPTDQFSSTTGTFDSTAKSFDLLCQSTFVAAIIFSGSALEGDIESYVGFGTLFSFGEKLESVTYDYSPDSITTTSIDDFGLVSIGSTISIDFGQVASPINDGIDNYGLLVGSPLASTPFGSLYISGSALEAYSAQTPEDTQLFIISGSALESDSESYVGLGTLTLSGSALLSDISSYVTSGTLFSFGEKLESVTYDYNQDSVYENTDDYGLLTSLQLDGQFDYGFITGTSGSQPDENYGLVAESINSATSTPFGSLYISGSALERFTADTPEDTQLFIISGSLIEKETDSYVGLGTLTFAASLVESDSESYVGLGTLTLSGSALESDSESYVGLGTLTLSGSALEAYSAQTPEDLVLYTFSGSALESDSESYVGLGTLTLSGSALESDSESYVGLGTLTLSGSALESDSESYVGLGTLTLSGSALEAYSAQTPEDTQLFIISGSLIEKKTDSYVGLGTLTLSGSLIEKETDSYVGLGTLTVSGGAQLITNFNTPEQTVLYTLLGSALERFTANTPEDTQLFSISGVARTYSPIYPRNAGIIGSGTGLIRLNDDAGLTITRATLPYRATGGIFLSGSGPDRFSFANYDGFGTLDLSGIAPTRQIDVYQDYVTTGSIFISQQTQPTIEKIVNTYIGIGTIVEFGSVSNVRFLGSWFASGTINLGKTLTTNYCGTGDQFSSNTNTFDSTISTFDLLCNDSILVTSSAVAESFSVQTPENTQLFSISGSALEAYSAQTPEDLVLYQFNGNLQESRTYGYDGSGVVATIGGQAGLKFLPGILGVGLFRFVTHLSDNLYDTCDSDGLTSDYQDSALVRFTANLLGSTQLFNVLGSANTQEINVYTQVGIGNVTLSGSLVERQTDSYLGTGTLYALSAGGKIEVDSYNGTGSLFGISGSSQSKSTQTPENALLITVSGTALTKLESEYSYSGISSVYVSGSASTRFEADYPYSGIGTITLSGQVVHPDIQFIPAPKGSGLFTFSGTSPNNTSRIGVLSGNKTLFAFSGGFESFSKVTYIGLGTVYIESTVGVAINNPFRIPRTYVVII